jgi:hypothetical protein
MVCTYNSISLFSCTLFRRDRTYCTYTTTSKYRSRQNPNELLNRKKNFLNISYSSHEFCHHCLFSKFHMFFSSVLSVLLLWQFLTLEVSFKLQLLFSNNQALHFIITWTFIKTILAFNRISIPSLYKRKILWTDYSGIVFILSGIASKVSFMNTDLVNYSHL